MLFRSDQFYQAVDAVYIASPHKTHYSYIMEALEHGKHVLCEKPMVLQKQQAVDVYACAKEHEKVLFEGIKTAYCPGFQKLLGIACSGVIGSVRNIEACFTKLERKDSRELTDRAYGGSFIELGSYVMLPILKMMGVEYERLVFDSIKDENGLDLFTKVTLRYRTGLATEIGRAHV